MSDNGSIGGVNIPPAVRAAGAAAASGAAVVAVRHFLARGSQQSKPRKPDDPLAAALDAALGTAKDALRPAVEESATAVGRYIGENLPDAMLEAVVPRFVEGFQEARERREADADEAELGRDDSDGGDDDG